MLRSSMGVVLLLATSAFVALQDRTPAVPMPRQDPTPAVPAPPPQDPKALAPVPEPHVSPVLRGDLPGRFTQHDPLEGVWRLQSRSVDGKGADAGTGYMIIGRSHLIAQFLAPGPDPEVPLLRAGTYTWKRTDNRGGVRMTAVFGYFNDEDGDVLLEPRGKVEQRRFERTATTLRMHQGGLDWLDFVRVE